MTDRTACCIPGCRRTFRAEQVKDSSELMCGKHWRTIDDRLRARHKLMRKRHRKIGRALQLNAVKRRLARRDTYDNMVAASYRLCDKSWDACKQDATIKAVMGAEVPTRNQRREMRV